MKEVNVEIKRLEEEKLKLPPSAETDEDKIKILYNHRKHFQNLGEYKNYLYEKTIALKHDEKFEEFKNKVFHQNITIF